jgi:tRNA-dihydrouridine synthase
MNLAALTVHGRTLKQLYTGKADWNEIALAAKITRTISPTTKVLGSGDVSTYQQALERVHTYQVDGALIGRATWGDPWIFSGRQVTLSERLDIALEHARAFTTLLPHGHFLALRKHMGWYMQGFPGSTQLRVQMLRVSSLSEIETIVTKAKQLLNEMK